MISILLVDDHDIVRTGISRILQDIADFKVLDTLESGDKAIKFCRKHAPQVVLMDMNMPGINGLEATKQIVRLCPDTKIIVLSAVCDNPIPAKVMQAGAFGFLTKGAGSEEMIRAIRKVASGQKYMAPEIAEAIALSQLGAGQNSPFEQLSQRELAITMMLTQGERVPDIAKKMNISSKTVNTYRYRMFEKLKVGSDVELTHLAIRHKLIHTEAF